MNPRKTIHRNLFLAAPLLAIAFTQIGRTQSAAGGPPDAVELAALKRLEPQRALAAEAYLIEMRPRLGMDERTTFQHRKSLTDPAGLYHGRFHQFFEGKRVLGANGIVHIERDGEIAHPTLRFQGNIPTLPAPSINEAEASQIAMQKYDPLGKLVEPEVLEKELAIWPKLETVDLGEPTREQRQDVRWRRHLRQASEWHLVYRMSMGSDSGTTPLKTYLIDAHSGAIVHEDIDEHNDGMTTATGKSAFNGDVDFPALQEGNQFTLTDRNRGSDGGSFVRNAHRSGSYKTGNMSHMWDGDNKWGTGKRIGPDDPTNTADAQTAGVEGMVAAKNIWDFYLNVFNRKGLDGDNLYYDIRTHWGSNYTDAKFVYHTLQSKRAVYLGDGSSSTTLPTIAHELGHGVWYYNFDKEYGKGKETRGLNEGHGDIAGSLAEYYAYAKGGTGNQLPVTAEADYAWHWRMVNPETYENGDEKGLRYFDADKVKGEEHVVGCLYGHFFVMLADGVRRWDPEKNESQQSTLASKFVKEGMVGMGVDAAARLWYSALTAYMPENADFYDMRDAYYDAASAPYVPVNNYNITRGALAAIGLSSYTDWNDNTAPVYASLTIKDVNEEEGYVMVEAGGQDNLLLSRVDFYLDNKFVREDTKLPLGGAIDINGLSGGVHSLRAEFFDVKGNKTFATQNFSMAKVEQLVVNGGFEDGCTGWVNCSSSSNSQSGFGSRGYMRVEQMQEAYQQVTIPADATDATLRFRLRTERHTSNPADEREMRVEVRDKNGALLQTLKTYKEEDVTDSEDQLFRNYKLQSFSLFSHRGKTIRIQFNGWNVPLGPDHRFKVDNVSLVVKKNINFDVNLILRGGERTIEATAVNFAGINTADIAAVKYYIDNQLVSSAVGTPFRMLYPTHIFANGQHTLYVAAYGFNNTLLASESKIFNLSPVNELIKNGNFNDGFEHWIRPGVILLSVNDPDGGSCSFGQVCVLMGDGIANNIAGMRQMINIPNNAGQARLTFRVKVKPGQNLNKAEDYLSIYRVDGLLHGTLLTEFTNLTKTDGAGSWSGWTYVSLNLPTQAGGIEFKVQHTGAMQTKFYVDAVSVTWTPELGYTN